MSISRSCRRLAVVLLLGSLTGCAQVYTGEAERDTGFDTGAVNVALLDTGNYPTKPRDPLGNADDPVKGAVLEGHRLAENVVLPVQVDRRLSHVGFLSSGVIKSPKAVGVFLENTPLADAVQAHNYLTGYVVGANDAGAPNFEQTLYLQNGVLEFPSDADAAAAATAMAEASNTRAASFDKEPVPAVPATVPGYPGTSARSWSRHYEASDKTTYSMAAFTPHGRFVLAQTTLSHQDLPTAAALITGALDQQIPLIDAFTPTAPDELVNLPRDPSGLEVRMMQPAEGNRTNENGTYGPHGALIFMSDLSAAQQQFTEFGVDVAIYQDGFLTRTKDAASAQKLLDADVTDRASSGWKNIDGIPGLPAARCQHKDPAKSGDSAKYWCAVNEDRLVLEIDGKQEIDVKQKTAAGYLMLTAK